MESVGVNGADIGPVEVELAILHCTASQPARKKTSVWHRLGLGAAFTGCSLWSLGGSHASEGCRMLVRDWQTHQVSLNAEEGEAMICKRQ